MITDVITSLKYGRILLKEKQSRSSIQHNTDYLMQLDGKWWNELRLTKISKRKQKFPRKTDYEGIPKIPASCAFIKKNKFSF